MAIDPARVKALFQAAIELPDPAARGAFLDCETGDDAELRDRLNALLAAYDQPPGALDAPLEATIDALTATVSVASPAANSGDTGRHLSDETWALLGSVIAGRYKLRDEIGEGGMGTVFIADQLQPVKRQVAVKLIKPGMDSKTVLARFEAERQALALMDHPHIAKVLDAGATEQGRPFFVMEHVKGIPLTDYCDQHRLELHERLTLFRQICSAVQHAHQKGIIHRDLKPSNILVESHDDRPVPKVIDFGLAKATSGLQLSEHSLYSAFGSVAGTPLYMAPEQASFNALDVDTRADIYALGVILYELLAGSTPISRETLKRAAIDEMLRLVREFEPPPPSQRISSSDTLPSLAASRHVEPAQLARFVRGDLDWIVMKALAKERNRRYESAIGLAHDIECFVNHEPVSAGPPTATYRLKKFVRRNRGQVIAVTVVLLSMIVGFIGTALGFIDARKQRRRAEARLTQVEKANAILGSVFKDLNLKRMVKQGKPLAAALGESLDQATRDLEGNSIGDPLSVARMQAVLGQSQLGLGNTDKAIDLLTRARSTLTTLLGPEHLETLEAINRLANGYREAAQFDRSMSLHEEVVALLTKIRGPEHSDTLAVMNDLAVTCLAAGNFERARTILEATVSKMKSTIGPKHPATLASTGNLAAAYHDLGQLDRAIALLEEIVPLATAELGPDHPSTLGHMSKLARAYRADGKFDRALRLYEETLTRRRAQLGPDHPDTLESLSDLALAFADARNFKQAIPLYEQTLQWRKAKLGPDHIDTLRTMSELAQAYKFAGEFDHALPLFEQVLALSKARYGSDHPDTVLSMEALASGFRAVGQLDRALPLFEESLERSRATRGQDHPATLLTMNDLAVACQDAGKVDRAIQLLEQLLPLMRAKYAADYPPTLAAIFNLAGAYRAAGQIDRALPLYEQVLARRKSIFGPDHPDTLASVSGLAAAYWSAKRLDRSIPLFEESLRLRLAKGDNDGPDTLINKANLGVNFSDAGRLADALPLLEAAADARGRVPVLRNIRTPLLDAYVRAGQTEKAAKLASELLGEGRAALSAGSLQLAGLLASTGMTRLQIEAWNDAEPVLRECLAIREKAEPDAWTTFNTKSMLGAALLGHKNFADAEPLLRAGYEGMKSRFAKIPPQARIRLRDALDRLIALADATNKPHDAKKWKEEKASLPADQIAPTPGEQKK